MQRVHRFVVAGAVLLGLAGQHCALGQTKAEVSDTSGVGDDWAYYGHDAGGTRYSPLKQINLENVAQLKVAWTYHIGDISDGKGVARRSGFESTPILVDGTLYVTTPFNRVIALDPETGKERWTFDPMIDTATEYGDGLINRGVATWLDPKRGKNTPCRRRIFEATLDARLIALDGASGTPCEDFGNRGQVSLRDVARYRPGKYHMTSPPVVIDDIVIVGSAIDDNSRVDMPGGAVRAYHARTGKLMWTWEPLPPNDPDSSEKSTGKLWRTGAGNAWTGLAVDP
jgi:quinoprotein glucose dehydrogenase